VALNSLSVKLMFVGAGVATTRTCLRVRGAVGQALMGSLEIQRGSVQEPSVTDLVAAAAAGGAAPWNAIVDRFAGLVWAIALS